MISRSLVESINDWGANHSRAMPWRSVTSLYWLAVAETLLQKTRGEDVVAVWEKVIDCFPTAEMLAGSDPAELTLIVKGLGLGSQRSNRLINMARVIHNRADDALNHRIPGLGSYGHSILSLANGIEPITAPVDGNISRIICRCFGLKFESGEARKNPSVRAMMGCLLALNSSPEDKIKTVYALVDLGSKVCLPRTPICLDCPLIETCYWYRSGFNSAK